MNENIQFTADHEFGKYHANDTGVMVAITRDYTDKVMAVVRLTGGTYVLAPLSDIKYDSGV